MSLDQTAPPRLAWRVSEIADRLGLPYKTTLEMVKCGQLPHFRAGRHYLVPDTALRELIDRAAAGELIGVQSPRPLHEGAA